MNRLLDDPSWESFLRFLIFPKFVLRAPRHGARKNNRGMPTGNIQSLVRDRIIMAVDHPLGALWEELSGSPSPAPRRSERAVGKKRPHPLSARLDTCDADLVRMGDPKTLGTVRALAADGAFSKALKHLTSEGMLDANDPAVVEQLRALHPRGTPPQVQVPRIRSCRSAVDLSLGDSLDERLQRVMSIACSFPNASAGGPSALRPGHLAELLRGGDEDSSRLLRALDRLVVTALQGDLHPVITEHICSARLFPLKKKNGKARPVAVGDTFRRVIEKVALALPASKELLASLLPIQTGLSGNAICEQVALSLQAILASNPCQGKWAVLQVDIRNAFNTVHRSAIVEAVGNHASHLLPWTQLSLQPSKLYLGECILQSSEGGQQGAPLSPLFFSLAIHEALRSCPSTQAHFWYLDDGTLVGDVTSLRECLRHLVPRLAAVGSIVDLEKTHMWGPGVPHRDFLGQLEPSDPLFGIPIIPYDESSGVSVLGCPIPKPGTVQFVRDCAESTVAQNDTACRLLSLFPDCQIQHALLRHCLDACRVNYLLRVCPLGPLDDIWDRADGVLRSTLDSIIKQPLSDQQWAQACLPLGHGGLGIRSASSTKGPARIAALHNWFSHAESQLGLKHTAHYSFPDTASLLSTLVSSVGPHVDPLSTWSRDGRITPQPGPHRLQHWWSDQSAIHAKTALLLSANIRDAVRISQTTGPGSSGWMAAPPSAALGLAFDSPTYRILLKWHLGIPLVPASLEGTACPLACGASVDTFGDHMVCCKRNKLWERHLGIQSYLSRCLQASAIPHRREQSAAGDLKRDADILIPSWDTGQGLAIDVGVAHT